jgi:hypothetical protein
MIELPDNVGISPIFNVPYPYPYRENGARGSYGHRKIKWEKKILVA